MYGPLKFFFGTWSNGDEYIGENQAPDPDRETENTRFRQEMHFEPIGEVTNHEQSLYGLRYSTMAWELGNDSPFHEEVGYWLWDAKNSQVMKSFIVPRGIAVNAGGHATEGSEPFTLRAEVGSETFGICSNPFLDREFKSLSYETTITKLSDNSFSYDETTLIKMRNREDVFHHTEKNTLTRKV